MRTLFPADCASRFTPGEKLGDGGFGSVYRAQDTKLGRAAAVKLLHADALSDAEQVARFAREAKVTAALAHPAIVTVLDAGAADGVPWIAYELLPGPSVRALLANAPLPAADAIAIARDVASALAAAHAAGVLHRDVKPENVLAAGDGRYKVTDFGIARWAGDTAVRTATGIILGTPAYVAPELVRGEAPGAACDVYALGVMLYEMLAGRRPFVAERPLDVLEMHARAEPPPPSQWCAGVPPALERVVLRALEKQPRDRWPDAAAFADALSSMGEVSAAAAARAGRPALRAGMPRTSRTVAASRGMEAVALGAEAMARQGKARGPAWPVAAAACGLVAAVAIGMSGGGGKPPPPGPTIAERSARLMADVQDLFAAVQRVKPVAREPGKAGLDALEGKFSRAVGDLRELGEPILGKGDGTAAGPGLALQAWHLLATARHLRPVEPDPEIWEILVGWAKRWPKGLSARYPLAAAMAQWGYAAPAEIAAGGPLMEELVQIPPPAKGADGPPLVAWLELHAHAARTIEVGRLDEPERWRLRLANGLAVLRALEAARWPAGAKHVEAAVLAFDDALVRRARELRTARDAGGGRAGALDREQALLEQAWLARETFVDAAPDGYDALVLTEVATQLETRTAKGLRATELVERMEARKGRFQFVHALIRSRRSQRDHSGEGLALAPATIEHSTSVAMMRKLGEDDLPLRAAATARTRRFMHLWAETVVWLLTNYSPNLFAEDVENHMNMCRARCGELWGTPEFADVRAAADAVLKKNMQAGSPHQ